MYNYLSVRTDKYILKFVATCLFAGFLACFESAGNPPPTGPPCEPGSPVTIISTVNVCSGTTTADVAVRVTSFNNIGSMSLKLVYPVPNLGVPELLSSHPGLWSNFVVNTSVSGIITISGYGAGLTLDDNTVLFTLRFTAAAGLATGDITFDENAQGTSCEYASGPPPDYTPFCDVPTENYYIPGGVLVNPVLSAVIDNYSDVPCHGGTNGNATVSASGGSGGFIYQWSNGQFSASATGLTAGNYSVTVTDALGCSASTGVILTQPPEDLSAVVNSVTHVTNYLNDDGSADVTADGGTASYAFLWSNGQTVSTASGLTAGSYTVTVTDAHGCTAGASVLITQPESICLNIRIFLQGPYCATNHLMQDSLRVHHYIPNTEPYSSAGFNQYFIHTGGGGGETVTDPAVFNVTGSNAIVDWVFLELRDRLNNSVVKHTRAALVQRDGDVTDVDGISPVCFTNPGDNRYYLSVRHRNHLGVMTAVALDISSLGTAVDFTNGSVTEFNWGTSHPVYPGVDYTGLSQSTPETGKRALWAGDANGDRRVIYETQADDQSIILSDVDSNTGNVSMQCGYNNCIGYYKGDLDMSGKAKYETPGDDRSIVLYQVIFYPLNYTYQAGYGSMVEQMPLP